MPKVPEISVIIPVYNSATNLRQCLDSILWQTFADIEVICINDGSDDHSLAILEEFAAKDNRFIIVDKYHGGVASAKNTGLDTARGKYVLFVEASDWIAHQLCERTYSKAEGAKADLVIFNMLPFNQQEIFSDCLFKYPKISGCFDPASVPRLLTYPTVSNLLFLRDLIKEMRFSEEIAMEDRPFLVEACIRAKKALLLDEALYYCRRKSDLEINGFGHLDYESIFRSMDAVRSVLKKYDLHDTFLEWVIDAHELATYHIQIKPLSGRNCRTFFLTAHQKTRQFKWDKIIKTIEESDNASLLYDKTYMHFVKCLRLGSFWRYSLGLMVENSDHERHLFSALPIAGRLIEWWLMLVRLVNTHRLKANLSQH